MNTVGIAQRARCCFIPHPLPTRSQTHSLKCTQMCISLRKLAVAVALSLTLSSHRPSMAALPPQATVTLAQQQQLTNTSTEKPRAASLANSFRSRGIPDSLTVMVISGLPVVELRGGIPLGHYLGMPALQTLFLAVMGNLAPIMPMMMLLRIGWVRWITSRFLERARKAADSVSNARSRAAALALFVGIPLPGTGAWTGCFVAFLLDMPMGVAFGAISVGVMIAGIIVSALCELGWIGAGVAACILLGAGALSLWQAIKAGGVQVGDGNATKESASS